MWLEVAAQFLIVDATSLLNLVAAARFFHDGLRPIVALFMTGYHSEVVAYVSSTKREYDFLYACHLVQTATRHRSQLSIPNLVCSSGSVPLRNIWYVDEEERSLFPLTEKYQPLYIDRENDEKITCAIQRLREQQPPGFENKIADLYWRRSNACAVLWEVLGEENALRVALPEDRADSLIVNNRPLCLSATRYDSCCFGVLPSAITYRGIEVCKKELRAYYFSVSCSARASEILTSLADAARRTQ